MAASKQGEKRVDLVCEGGVLEQEGWQAQNLAGTSAGAITAALIAAGYSADELKEVVFGLDFQRFATTEFAISKQRKQALYDSGRAAAEQLLSTWDFDAYLAAFRSGRTQSCTDEIASTYREVAHV